MNVPLATTRKPGSPSSVQHTVEPHVGQKRNVMVPPLSPLRAYVVKGPATTALSSG